MIDPCDVDKFRFYDSDFDNQCMLEWQSAQAFKVGNFTNAIGFAQAAALYAIAHAINYIGERE